MKFNTPLKNIRMKMATVVYTHNLGKLSSHCDLISSFSGSFHSFLFLFFFKLILGKVVLV